MSAMTSDARTAAELASRLRAVTIGRLAALLGVSALLGGAGDSLVDPQGWELLFGAALGYLVFNLAALALPARRLPQRLALDLSLLVDAAAIGVTLAVTGGPASPLSFLLYAEVVALTLVFGWWTGVRICVLLSLSLAWVASTGPSSLLDVVALVRQTDPALANALDPTIRTMLLLVGVWFVAALVASLSTVTERELRGVIEDLALIRQVNHELDASQGMAQVADGVAATLVGTCSYERAVVWLAEGDELVAAGGADLEEAARAELGSRRVSLKSYPLRDAVEKGAPLPVRRTDARPRALERFLGVDTALVLVPLGTEERLLGMISATVPRRVGRPPRLGGRDVRLLTMLAGEASLVLDNARLHAELRARAVTDALTGLPNHGFFQQRLEEELVRLSRRSEAGEDSQLSVALFDLDHFKQVNDNYGHPTGDAVLRSVAGAAQRVLRSSDVVCRYGGEEFAVILPDTSGAEAVRACERIRTSLHQVDIEAEDGRALGTITASFGVATTSGEQDRSALVATADEAPYAAKHQGRDRVVRESTAGTYIDLSGASAHEAPAP